MRASGVEADEAEPRGLVEPERHVHRLHTVAGRALHQVVDGTERDDAVAARIEREPDVREVRAGDELGLGVAEDAAALLHDAHERLARVARAVQLPELLLVDPLLDVDVRRGKGAAHQLDARHREVDARSRAAEGELLLDLRGVAVPDGPERAHDADALGMMRILRGLPAALA